MYHLYVVVYLLPSGFHARYRCYAKNVKEAKAMFRNAINGKNSDIMGVYKDYE